MADDIVLVFVSYELMDERIAVTPKIQRKREQLTSSHQFKVEVGCPQNPSCGGGYEIRRLSFSNIMKYGGYTSQITFGGVMVYIAGCFETVVEYKGTLSSAVT